MNTISVIILISTLAIDILFVLRWHKQKKQMFKIDDLKNVDAVNRLQQCEAHFLITMHKGKTEINVNYNMDEQEIIRMTTALSNFFQQSEANIEEIKNLLK